MSLIIKLIEDESKSVHSMWEITEFPTDEYETVNEMYMELDAMLCQDARDRLDVEAIREDLIDYGFICTYLSEIPSGSDNIREVYYIIYL